MVITMNRVTGVAGNLLDDSYGEEVLNAGWANVPRVELQLVYSATPASNARLPPPIDVDAFMRRLYACQE